jgi:hypothetical protein
MDIWAGYGFTEDPDCKKNGGRGNDCLFLSTDHSGLCKIMVLCVGKAIQAIEEGDHRRASLYMVKLNLYTYELGAEGCESVGNQWETLKKSFISKFGNVVDIA